MVYNVYIEKNNNNDLCDIRLGLDWSESSLGAQNQLS